MDEVVNASSASECSARRKPYGAAAGRKPGLDPVSMK